MKEKEFIRNWQLDLSLSLLYNLRGSLDESRTLEHFFIFDLGSSLQGIIWILVNCATKKANGLHAFNFVWIPDWLSDNREVLSHELAFNKVSSPLCVSSHAPAVYLFSQQDVNGFPKKERRLIGSYSFNGNHKKSRQMSNGQTDKCQTVGPQLNF